MMTRSVKSVITSFLEFEHDRGRLITFGHHRRGRSVQRLR
jgi:hypothetical protein